MNTETKEKEPRKPWTAHIATKILAYLLILACCWQILELAYKLKRMHDSSLLHWSIVISDIDDNYFFDRNMPKAYANALTALYYGSEASIEAGEYMSWEEDKYGCYLTTPYDSYYGYGVYGEIEYHIIEANIEYDDEGDLVDTWLDSNFYDGYTYNEYDQNTFYESEGYVGSVGNLVYVGVPDDLEERKVMLEHEAIRSQLFEYRSALEYLQYTDGLVYHLSSSQGTVPGSVRADGDWFRSQRVYAVFDESNWEDTSAGYPDTYFWESGYNKPSVVENKSEVKIYLAFIPDAVGAYNEMLNSVKDFYIERIAGVLALAALAFALLIVLLVGIGRKYQSNAISSVHFHFYDKIFLDISLAIIAALTVAAVWFSWEIFEEMSGYANASDNALTAFFALASFSIVSPLLYWLITLTKRLKHGKAYKHTFVYWFLRLIYRVARGAAKGLARGIKGLWAGAKLTGKVTIIILAFFCMILIVGVFIVWSESVVALFFLDLVFCAISFFFLLRYAGRIYKLEQAAREVSQGSFDTPIDIGGGELGSIADSLMSISKGINTAVDERMKSERLKTELITNVSHDIRTPLTSIITYADLLKNEGINSKKAPEYLDVLVQKSQRLKTLTDDLFEAAKAATGNIKVEIMTLDIVSLINQVIGELDSAVKSSGLDLRLGIPSHLAVRADGKLMRRVMENLLSNVFKYSLEKSRVYLDVSSGGNKARVDLKNISSDELNFDPAEITERFKRGDESRSSDGSGLGLSIVSNFVAAQGGEFKISIDGDLFKATIWLPLADTPDL